MNRKILFATLAGGVAAFLLGWLIFGLLLMDFYTANTTVYSGLFKEMPNMVTIALGCFIWAFLISWVYSRFAGKKSVMGSAVTAAILGLLFSVYYNLNLLGNFNLYSPLLLGVDVVMNTIYSSLVGVVTGFILKDRNG